MTPIVNGSEYAKLRLLLQMPPLVKQHCFAQFGLIGNNGPPIFWFSFC